MHFLFEGQAAFGLNDLDLESRSPVAVAVGDEKEIAEAAIADLAVKLVGALEPFIALD